MASERPRSSTSPLPPRKRRRPPITPSPPRSPEEEDHDEYEGKRRRKTDLSVEVCKDFTRNTCRRSEVDCKYAHPHSAVSIDNDKVTACADAVRNKCFRGRTCRFYHPPPHIQATLLKALDVQEVNDQDFLRGRCERKSCRYSHGQVHLTPQDFLRGRCERKSCRYSHGQVHLTPQVHLVPYGVLMKLPSSPPRTGNDKEIVPVCKDFLKKKCLRDECKYAHPDSQTEVIDNQVEVCRDFRRGVCQRPVCRFYHPQKQA